MKIKLHSGYTLNGDAYNYWLTKTVTPKKSDASPYERVCSGYFQNIEDVFASAMERGIKDSDAESFSKLIKHIDKVRRDLKKAAKGLNELLSASKDKE